VFHDYDEAKRLAPARRDSHAPRCLLLQRSPTPSHLITMLTCTVVPTDETVELW